MSFLKSIILTMIFILGIILKPFLWLASLFVKDVKRDYYHNKRSFTHHECECDKLWHDNFKSENIFEQFETNIPKQFEAAGITASYDTKPKIKFLLYEYGAEGPEGGYIYICKKCNHLWELSYPDNAYRGYFKGINMNMNEINPYLI